MTGRYQNSVTVSPSFIIHMRLFVFDCKHHGLLGIWQPFYIGQRYSYPYQVVVASSSGEEDGTSVF